MAKIIVAIICLCMLQMNVSAYSYPSSFWSINSKYEQALKNNDHQKIIEYGNQIISLMSGAADGEEKRNIIVTRYNQIGNSYAALGEYDSSAEIFGRLYDYASNYGDEFYGYIKNAKAKKLQYKSEIRMYTDKGTSIYYGAKNEKSNGVLFGVNAKGETRSKLENESMILTYQELGQDLWAENRTAMKKAAQSGCAIEFALNCPEEGDDIKNIKKKKSSLNEISDLFAEYPDVPVYLRFAAEFDVWTVLADAEEFKTAFRYVSEYFKSRNDNVAIVWSPNQSSNWYVNIDDYYPGDEYVDWVGVSLYSQKYFLGDKTQDEDNAIIFKTGINSDPVLAIKDIIEKYGDRKPVMLSESGCGHKLVKTGEDATEFALKRLKQQYCYLPMIYPQIKLMAYFDWYVEGPTEKNDYRLSTSSALQNEYLRLVRSPRFIQNSYDSSTGYCNRPIYNGVKLESIFELSCYAHSYNANLKKVTYFIDGEYVGMSNEIPYTTFIDASAYTGNHTLRAIASFDNGKKLITESDVYINNTNRDITVEISDKQISFDQDPVLYNDRTMVPMRKIFEELGASVSWDGDTQTATGKKGSRTVKISIGQKTMTVNNQTIDLDTAPMILSDRTLVPARAVAEGLGCDVDWDSRYNLVSITPKVFEWSEWDEDLPRDVNDDLFYIEEREEYRFRTREKEYFTKDYKIKSANLEDEKISYGTWSNWQDEYIEESDDIEVETRRRSEPVKYHYAHWCTGTINDVANRYKTWDHKWHDECTYHDLGWFDSPLPYSDDSTSNYAFYVDGQKYRCSNSCFRWYLIETEGGDYTQYRYRTVEREYVYWEWSGWSKWSGWDEDDPYDYYERDEVDMDIDERTVYRYKEMG